MSLAERLTGARRALRSQERENRRLKDELEYTSRLLAERSVEVREIRLALSIAVVRNAELRLALAERERERDAAIARLPKLPPHDGTFVEPRRLRTR